MRSEVFRGICLAVLIGAFCVISATPVVSKSTKFGSGKSGGPFGTLAGLSTGNDLLVADAGSAGSYGSIRRFAVGKDGLPSSSPVGTLTGGMLRPFGMAVDRDGYLYVSDVSTDLVNVYAPGATGNAAPIRTLAFPPNIQPQHLALDRRGYLFVLLGSSSTTVAVYAPGAHGLAKPIHTMGSFGVGLTYDILVDETGALYELEGSGVAVFARPTQRWQTPDKIIAPEGGNLQNGEVSWWFIMALDEATDRLYIQTSAGCICNPWDDSDFAIRDINQIPRSTLDPELRSKDCTGISHGVSFIYGTIISGKYFIASCDDDSSVYVYLKQPGRQHLVESIGDGLWATPASIVLAP